MRRGEDIAAPPDDDPQPPEWLWDEIAPLSPEALEALELNQRRDEMEKRLGDLIGRDSDG